MSRTRALTRARTRCRAVPPARGIGLLAATCLLALGACGGDEPEEETSSDGTGTPPAAQGPQTWPLTGLPVPEGESAERPHPVIVAKVDNSGNAPQAGLSAADLVVEELVEGGTTRLAAFFYSELPAEVGAMRSMRASDIGIVSPVDADIVTSGAAPITRKRISGAGIDYIGENRPGFRRDDGREAPYNLMADLTVIAERREQEPARPPDYLSWGAADASLGGRPVKAFDVRFSFAHTTSWTWTGEDYRREPEHAPADDVFLPDTVLVLEVRITDAGYRDPAGNPVPETVFEGRGDAMIFSDGSMVRGTWSKEALDQPLVLSTNAGELKIPAGRVWIELVPAKDGKVTLR